MTTTAYTTVLDLKSNPITSGSLNELTDAEIQVQVDVANETIDAAMRPSHALPLNSIPTMLSDAARTIAAYRLMLFSGFQPSNTSDVVIQTRYYEVIGDPTIPGSGLLHRISKGSLLFDNAVDGSPSLAAPIVRRRGSSSCDTLGRSYGVKR